MEEKSKSYDSQDQTSTQILVKSSALRDLVTF